MYRSYHITRPHLMGNGIMTTHYLYENILPFIFLAVLFAPIKNYLELETREQL